ncbi:MAG: SMP-30/gluconolactonase/LRE family protein [Myxococcota bacterium]
MTQMHRFELLATGYGLIEGPRVDSGDNLFFSDVQGGGVYRRAPDGDITTIVPKRRGVGGIALHADGGVIVSGRNVCHVKDGNTRVLFDLEDAAGFNDLFTNDSGQVLVGSMGSNPFEPSEPHKTGGLYLIMAEGKATRLYEDVSLSNGIGFSPDHRTLYHSDSARNHVIVHDLDEADRPVNRRALADTPKLFPDGLAVDEEGCIWVADYGAGCVRRFRPNGDPDMHIDVPASRVTSLCFGGSDSRDLYVVTADNTDDPKLAGSIFRTRVETPGLQVPLATI